MKIALFSDIHANLPALEACLKSIDEHNPDAVYCLGDLVGYNVWPNEVVNEIRRRRIPTIAGNYDQGIGLMNGDCGCAYKTDHDKDLGQQSIAFTDSIVKPDERRYLRTLPAHIRVEFQLNNDKLNLLLVHGSPRKINEYLFEDRDENSLLRIMEQADADIMCFGHTHKPYHRVLPTEPAGEAHYRHAINIGSVGKPKDNNPQGCYVLLTINADSSIANKDAIQVEFVRFDYDVETAAKAIEDSPLPNDFAEMLRRGY
ncbi:metallophosphoesterase family protein [Aridibaculum aurantiacum]|uniref:metallophosphoesterase family protein n=1 Tax=Aridibaculum aurantiacum TaxID=2810307 RepID=UPI001A979E38|nr:metallophosphoesterase family protein [Aridibaculum aurantiacum]